VLCTFCILCHLFKLISHRHGTRQSLNSLPSLEPNQRVEVSLGSAAREWRYFVQNSLAVESNPDSS